MSPTRLFSIAIAALTGFCTTVDAQTTVTVDFQGSGVIGALLDQEQTPVDTPFSTTVAGNDPSGTALVFPGLTITTLGASSDPNAVVNGTLNNGIGVNSDVNTNMEADSEEPDQVEVAFAESLTFTFNQDVTITEVEFFGLDSDPMAAESVSFGGQTLLGEDGAGSDVFTFTAPGLFFAANDPIVFSEISGNGVGLETFTIITDAEGIPEPGSLAMLGMGSCLMIARRRRR